jgi:hypothetical protein
MKLKIYYCKSWFRLKKTAIEIMDEFTARQTHTAGEPYVALIGSDTSPHCFVEILPDKEMIGVGFLDQHQREYLTYQFHTKQNNQLFLSMATHREFEDDTSKIKNGTCYIFHEDGNVIIRKETFDPHITEETTARFEAKNNYENMPTFGDYSRLIVADR